MQLVTEPIVYSRPVYAGSYTEAVTMIKNEALDQGQTSDTWYESEVEYISLTSAFNTS